MADPDVSGELRYLQGFRVAGATRKAMWQGREHYVVPVVALMEGVIHAVNASNAEFVPFRTFAQNVNQWNGRPLMLGHPVRDGIHIAANEPTVLESSSFGAVFNARIEKKRLMMDAYVDPDRLKALGRHELLARVAEGKPIEISIGAAVATDNNEGEWNGKPYKGNWLALSADHLAFLENGRGACSLEMGCGAHRAMAAQEDLMDDDSIAARIAAAVMKILGGKGSGNFGHAGRPGKVGGSGEGDGGKATDEEVADWASEFAMKKGSAFEVWMHPDDQRKLHDIVKAGGKVKSYSGAIDVTHDDGNDRVRDWVAKKTEAAKAQGFKLFASEVSDESQDLIFVKKDVRALGGKGSGNFGHEGRPGKVGGSAPDGEGSGGDGKSGGKSKFKEGSSVVIGDDFWVAKHRGREGTIKTISESADGKPTAWVKYKDHDGGSFVLFDSLKPAGDTPKDDDEKPNWFPGTEGTHFAGKPLSPPAAKAEKPKDYTDRKHGDVLAKSPRGTVEKYGDEKRPFAARSKSGELLGTYASMANAKEAIHNQAAITHPDNFPSGWRNPKPAPKWRDLEQRDLAAYKDCPMCQGSGETNGNPCDGCEGTGELKVAEYHGDTDMTRQGLIDKITGCACSGFTQADLKGLEALTDGGLKALADFVEKKEKGEMDDEDEEAKKKAAEDEKRSLQVKVAALETELRAASTKKLTLDEFTARAPEEVLTLLAEKKARDEAEIDALVGNLKVASEGVYTETELRAMSAPQLRNLAKIAKVATPDFSGQGVPILRAAARANENFTPPNPYDAVLKSKQ